MFYSREKEIVEIKKVLSNNKKAIVVYGKRRVGKTTLIKEIMKDGNEYIYFECIKDTIKNNIDAFRNVLVDKKIIIPDYISFNSFTDVFHYIESLNVKYNIIFDEYPYLYEVNDQKAVDSSFQTIVDTFLKNCNLILCGSSVKLMKTLLIEGNPLFGRFDLVIKLQELNYIEISQFYDDKSIYDKIAFYSCFGGSPYVNEYINPKLSLKENIINLFLNDSSPVFNYADNVLISDANNSLQAKKILSVLGNSKKKYSELEALLDREKTGKINYSLKSLVEIGIIRKNYPINKSDDSKKVYYEIKDNVLRFYYTYVYKNFSSLIMLGEEAFYNEYIDKTLVSFISHRFEEQSRDYFSLLSKKGLIKGIKNIGTYYYDDKENKTNGEFDIALETNDGYKIYEVKYLKNPVNKRIVEEEVEQIKQIKLININSIGFISVNGFDFDDDNYDLICGDNIYNI